ncbi:MAG: nitroreductase, partial [Fimbriimonadaceae bacterium]|nr:nitroreductase [Alphaproteobacteria bacterium]
MPGTMDFLLKRRSTLAVMLEEPGPSETEIELILTAGSRVPDHGKLVPWRFILFSGAAREKIGETLAEQFAKENPKANEQQIENERQLFLRAPLVIGVISTAMPHDKVPEWEQQLTTGAVCQNILHAAGALGY